MIPRRQSRTEWSSMGRRKRLERRDCGRGKKAQTYMEVGLCGVFASWWLVRGGLGTRERVAWVGIGYIVWG